MEPARRRLTYDDLLRADHERGPNGSDLPQPELIGGEIVRKASPRAAHGYVHGRLVRGLGPSEDAPDGWWILIAQDVVFDPHDVVRPDLAGWRRSRLPQLPSGRVGVRPDWICEILSPSHEAHDRVTKRSLYAEHGVPWLWLVSPEERTVEVFELRDGLWVLAAIRTAGEAVLPPFAHPIDVGRLFVPLPTGEPPVAKEPELSYG